MMDLLHSSFYCFAIVFGRRDSVNPHCPASAQEKLSGWLWHEHQRKKERQCQAEFEAWFYLYFLDSHPIQKSSLPGNSSVLAVKILGKLRLLVTLFLNEESSISCLITPSHAFFSFIIRIIIFRLLVMALGSPFGSHSFSKLSLSGCLHPWLQAWTHNPMANGSDLSFWLPQLISL